MLTAASPSARHQCPIYVTTTSDGGHVHVDPDGFLYYFHCPGKIGFGRYITATATRGSTGWSSERRDSGSTSASRCFKPRNECCTRIRLVLSVYFAQGTYAYRREAYTGWVPEIGHGIVHKRSFVPMGGTRRVGSPGDDAEGGGGSPVWPFVLVGVVVLGAGALILTHRRRRADAPAA